MHARLTLVLLLIQHINCTCQLSHFTKSHEDRPFFLKRPLLIMRVNSPPRDAQR